MSGRRKSEVHSKSEIEVEYLLTKVQTLKVTSVSRETGVYRLIDREKSMGDANLKHNGMIKQKCARKDENQGEIREFIYKSLKMPSPKNKNQRNETNDTQKTKSKPKTFHRNKGSDGNRNRNSSTHQPPTQAHHSQGPNPCQYVINIHNQNSGSNVDNVISHSNRPSNRPYPYRNHGPSGSHHHSSNAHNNQYGNPNMNRFPCDNPPPYHTVPPPPYYKDHSAHFSCNSQDTFPLHSNQPLSANFNLQKHRNINPPRNKSQPQQQFNPPRNQNQRNQQASNKETPNTQYKPQSKGNQKGQNHCGVNSEPEHVKHQKPRHTKIQKEECRSNNKRHK